MFSHLQVHLKWSDHRIFIESVKMKTQKTGPKELPKRFLEDSKKADFLLLSNRKFAPAFKMRLNFFLCKGEEVKLLNNP